MNPLSTKMAPTSSFVNAACVAHVQMNQREKDKLNDVIKLLLLFLYEVIPHPATNFVKWRTCCA